MRAIAARFDSRCSLCDQLIVGDVDQVVELDDEWVHARCAIENGYVIGDQEDKAA